MISTKTLQDRLVAQNETANFARFIGGAGTLASAEDKIKTQSPSVFVLTPSEIAQANSAGSGVTRNPTDIRFRVLVAFKLTKADSDITDALEATRDGIKAALIGWTPDSETYDPIEPRGSAILDIDVKEGFLLYAVDFASHYEQRTP